MKVGGDLLRRKRSEGVRGLGRATGSESDQNKLYVL